MKENASSNARINRKRQYLIGVRAGIPVIIGFIPAGIAYAVMARQAGFSVFETVFMSLSVFAGASQMLASGMIAQGAGVVAIILATFILNLRHLIMSTCVIDRLNDGGKGIRLLAAFGVTDETFAIFTSRDEEKSSIYCFLGLATVAYSSWNLGSAIGAVASGFFPAIVAASFSIALYAMFVGLLVPNITNNFRLGILVVLTAVCNTVLAQFIASSWALIISTLLCAFIGVYFVDLPDGESESSDEQ